MNLNDTRTADSPTTPPRILLVDDEGLSRALVRQHLPPGYEVTECANADDALGAVRASAHDAALVDVEMPGQDGFALCRHLRGNPLTAEMPVILVTAKSGIEDLERGFEAGATDYIRKPFNPRELHARVRNAVELKLRRDSARRWRERIALDLDMAGALQRSLLAPRPFLRPELQVFTAYRPSTEVGGDLFGILPLPDGRIALYVGDVAGHGVGAALAATFLNASLSEMLRTQHGLGPAQLANNLHRLFIEQIRTPGLYATLLLALVEPRLRRWQCINCGQPAPIVLAPPGLKRRDFETRGGPPIGFALAGERPFTPDDEVNLDLPEDAAILMVTDGLLEAENHLDPEASPRKTLSTLVGNWRCDRSAPPMTTIMDGMVRAGFQLGGDDYTALLVEQIPREEIVFSRTVPLSAENLTALGSEVERALADRGWPEPSTWATHLLVVEHGANVLRHGKCGADGWVSVQVRCRDRALELLVGDSGQPWKYEEAPTADPEGLTDRGRGLMMIRRIASHIASHRADDRNFTLFAVQRDWRMPA